MRQFHVTGYVYVGATRAYGLTDTARVDTYVNVTPTRGATPDQVRRAVLAQVWDALYWGDYDRARAIPADPLDVTEIGEEPIDVLLRREGAPLLPLFESV